MNTLSLIALLTGFSAFLTYLWLVSRAFHTHTGWGMAVLLLSPFSAVVFGVKHWRADKAPFLAYSTTTIAATALWLYLFSSWGGWELLHASQQVKEGITTHTLTERDTQSLISASQSFDEQSGLDMQSSKLLAQAKRELALQAESLAAATAAAETEAAGKKRLDFDRIDKKVKPVRERYRLAYVTIKVADAPNYIGSTVKITRKNVIEKEYRLVNASGNRLELSQRAGSGMYTFRFRNSDIEKIRVLTKQPY